MGRAAAGCRPRWSEEAGDEQQRVAGEEEADEQARLGEHDGRQEQQTALFQQLLRVQEAGGEDAGVHEEWRLPPVT